MLLGAWRTRHIASHEHRQIPRAPRGSAALAALVIASDVETAPGARLVHSELQSYRLRASPWADRAVRPAFHVLAVALRA